MAAVIYILCAVTATLCAVLLLRQYRATKARLVLWSGLCFAGLALNNVLLVIDTQVITAVDLEIWRTIPAVIGVGLLVYGLVWEAGR